MHAEPFKTTTFARHFFTIRRPKTMSRNKEPTGSFPKFNTGDPASAVSISKRHVIKSELETACVLFYEHADVVPIHVLASAAWEIIQPIAKARGVRTTRQELESIVEPHTDVEAFRSYLAHPYNFMKHGRRDADAVLDDFQPEYVQFTLFAAVMDYQRIFEEYLPAMLVYRVWFMLQHPNIVLSPNLRFQRLGSQLFQTMEPMRLIQLLREHPEIIESLHA